MRTVAWTFVALALCSSAPADDLRAHLEKQGKIYDRLMLKKDFEGLVKAMKPDLTSDFVYTENGQSEDADKMLSEMKLGLSGFLKVTKVTSKILTLQQNGTTASGTAERTMGGIILGQDKKKHKMTFTGVSKDTYVQEGKKWKMAKMEWGNTKATMDGKTIDPTKMQ